MDVTRRAFADQGSDGGGGGAGRRRQCCMAARMTERLSAEEAVGGERWGPRGELEIGKISRDRCEVDIG